MKIRRFWIRRVLAFAIAVSTMFVITALGLLLVSKPIAAFAGQVGNGQIVSFLGQLCLQPVNESTAQGAAIVQEPCNEHTAQQWTSVPVGGNNFH